MNNYDFRVEEEQPSIDMVNQKFNQAVLIKSEKAEGNGSASVQDSKVTCDEEEKQQPVLEKPIELIRQEDPRFGSKHLPLKP